MTCIGGQAPEGFRYTVLHPEVNDGLKAGKTYIVSFVYTKTDPQYGPNFDVKKVEKVKRAMTSLKEDFEGKLETFNITKGFTPVIVLDDENIEAAPQGGHTGGVDTQVPQGIRVLQKS